MIKHSLGTNVRRVKNFFEEGLTEKDDYCFYYYKDNELVCSCFLRDDRINNLVVHPKHRNQGIGSEMVRYVIDFASELGFEKVTIIPQENDDKLREYYSNLGFVGKDMDTVDDTDKDNWIMEYKIGD